VSAANRLLATALLLAASAFAHVGSPDVYFQGNAGPYRVLVAIRPPDVIPGVARIEVRALDPGVDKIELTPTPMTGEASKHPPTADVAQRSASDPRYFEGALWLMSFGAWEVHIRASGSRGSGELPVPVSAVAIRTRPMQTGVGYFLFGMMLFLSVGLVAIVGAAVRESRLEPGAAPVTSRGRTFAWMGFTTALLVAALWFGKTWWAGDAADYARKLYRPLDAIGTLQGSQMDLRLSDPGWLAMRRLDDLVPDHGHLMHLFLVRFPALDEFAHLHPEQTAPGFFSITLPAMPPGRYRIYADVVHESGLAETAVGNVDLPGVSGGPLKEDDAYSKIPDPESAIQWVRDPSQSIRAKRVALFSFRLKNNDAIEPYMGMGGHAEFMKNDGSVFAHIHPSGSVAMASMAVASREAMMAMHAPPGPVVSFPFGLPSPGRYRVFVQIKHGGKIDTGAFDFEVR
jgi:hypothetical protein